MEELLTVAMEEQIPVDVSTVSRNTTTARGEIRIVAIRIRLTQLRQGPQHLRGTIITATIQATADLHGKASSARLLLTRHHRPEVRMPEEVLVRHLVARAGPVQDRLAAGTNILP